jgi:HD-GYP domain-containing protein (c-di-GMP phosphodiesterase class II)
MMKDLAVSSPLQTLGRELVQNLFVALRSAQLYEPSNATLRSAAKRLVDTIEELVRIDGLARLDVGGSTLLVNDQRVRSELRTHSIHMNLIRFLRTLGVGGFKWSQPFTIIHATRFVSALSRLEHTAEDASLELVQQELTAAGVTGVELLPPQAESTDELRIDPNDRDRAERTYRHTVAVTSQLMESVRSGRTLQRHRVRRAVQSIVDQIMEDETLLLGLTNLRDYSEPTFTHCVNVSIFSIGLGQKIGLSRLELYDLGMAALLHDIGKSEVPPDVLNKPGKLEDAEWEWMKSHTWRGARRIIADRAPGTLPAREMLAAFEHHLHLDLSGYPKLFAPRELTFYTKIIEIADAFDAGTTPRIYKTDPITPAEMIGVLYEGRGKRFDAILVKAFISLLGIYPMGCVCLLDSFEIVVVVAADPDPINVHRPRAKIVADRNGNRIDGPIVSLAEKDEEGQFRRTVVAVVEPERYAIDLARVFLAP